MKCIIVVSGNGGQGRGGYTLEMNNATQAVDLARHLALHLRDSTIEVHTLDHMAICKFYCWDWSKGQRYDLAALGAE